MQALARTSSAGTAYSAAQVAAILSAPAVVERWRYFVIDIDGKPLSEITSFVDRTMPPVVQHDSTRAVQRSLVIVVRKDATLGTLSSLIQVHYYVLAPDGGYLDFTIGTFTVVKKEPALRPAATWLRLTGADLGQILTEVKFLSAYAVPAGANVVQAVLSVIGTYLGARAANSAFIVDRGYTVPTAIGWKAGDSRLTAVSDLLASMAYTPPFFDETGVPRSDAIPDYALIQPTFVFNAALGASTIDGEIQGDVLDITGVPNIVRVDVEDPQRAPISVTYTNNNPASAISVPNSFPRMMVIKDSTQVNGTTAMSLAFSQAQKAAQVYATATVSTSPWPVSQNLDVYGLVLQTSDEGTVVRNYLELGWKMECAPGAKTVHTWQRVVPA